MKKKKTVATATTTTTTTSNKKTIKKKKQVSLYKKCGNWNGRQVSCGGQDEMVTHWRGFIDSESEEIINILFRALKLRGSF